MSKWENIDAGPRQVKDLQAAMSNLRRVGQQHVEVTGVIGGEEHRTTLWSMMSPVRPEVLQLDLDIREKYGHQVSKSNVRQIIADYLAACADAAELLPVQDNRITAEVAAERAAASKARYAAEQEQQAKYDALMAQVMAKAPAGATRLIVAEYQVDTSDAMTDYFANRTDRVVAIGWGFGNREDFRRLRYVASRFPETAHLDDPSSERRDNYSMGGGNCLSDHGGTNSGTGWVVRSRTLPCKYVHLTEDAISETPEAAPVTVSAEGITVRPSSIGRAGVVEIVFADKPAPEVLSAVKAHRFRWAKTNRCWYGTDVEFANKLAGVSS